MAPTLHRTSEKIRGSIRPCGSRPDICKFFTSCFCTTAWCCHDAMRVPTTRRRQDAPSSSGRRVPTTPPSIVGRGVLTMPPRVVRTSWRRHDAPPVPRRQLRFSDGDHKVGAFSLIATQPDLARKLVLDAGELGNRPCHHEHATRRTDAPSEETQAASQIGLLRSGFWTLVNGTT